MWTQPRKQTGPSAYSRYALPTHQALSMAWAEIIFLLLGLAHLIRNEKENLLFTTSTGHKGNQTAAFFSRESLPRSPTALWAWAWESVCPSRPPPPAWAMMAAHHHRTAIRHFMANKNPWLAPFVNPKAHSSLFPLLLSAPHRAKHTQPVTLRN
jgi:hypothetical protein